jgi:mannonate dehydratase
MTDSIKLGFGLYRHQLDSEHFDFARQCGATHLVVHLCDYFSDDPIWTYEGLEDLKSQVEAHDLKIWAVENFDPAMWSDILLDGPAKESQMEGLQQVIRNVGRAGIGVFGYNFSMAGVCSREVGPVARGNARSVYMREVDDTPVPAGMVWNMQVDAHASGGDLEYFPHSELWQRLQWFLEHLVPVAEEAGVRLAAHPDDPPMPVVRNTPRLVYQPDLYHQLLDMVPSRSNALEFCLGTIAEMTEGDVYTAVDTFCKRDAIAYLHFRNVSGKVPCYQETFIDEGDVNMFRVLEILKANDYQGVLIPDHTPLMSCDAPWHSGMAYAMGYMKAALQQL